MIEGVKIYDRAYEAIEKTYAGELIEDGIHFPNIPLSTTYFINQLLFIYEQRKGCKFLEVGCGIGSKSLLAKLLSFQVTGFDIRSEYIEKAKKLFQNAEVDGNFFTCDALDFDGYGEFDVIYSYHPFINKEDELKLEKKIVDSVQPSTILFLPMTDYPLIRGWKMIRQDIFIY